MAESEEKGSEYHEGGGTGNQQRSVSVSCRSIGGKCSHLAKKQRAKFYILRRCIAMLVCWNEREK
ncbi:hypothetical protein OROGR_024098 [Orobanche gracilis]